MNRKELVADVAERSGETQQAVDRVLKALEESIGGALAAGDRVALPGFFTVDVTERAARTGRNPQTGETLEIPAGKSVRIKAGAGLKSAVSGS